MHVVDSTLFFAPRSGGVKRYLLAKQQYLKTREGVKHSIIVPGPSDKNLPEGMFEVASPALPFCQGYRLPMSVRVWTDRLCRAAPTIIEAGDPYHLAWAALKAGDRLDVPVVAFAHSDLSRMI